METAYHSRSPSRPILARSWLFLTLFLCSQFYLLLPRLGLPRQWSTAFLKALPEIVVWIGLSTALVLAVRRWPPPRRISRWLAGHAIAAVASSALAIIGSAILMRGVGVLAGQDWPLVELLTQIFEMRLHLGILIYVAILAFAVFALGHGHFADPPASASSNPVVPQPPESQRRLRHLVARERERTRIIEVDDVVWIEAARNYAIVHTEMSYPVRMTLAELESTLDPERFARVHRSAIVAVGRIRELAPRSAGERELLLVDGTRLTMTRTFRDRLESALGQRV